MIECCREPDAALTVTAYLCVGGGVLAPPPQPASMVNRTMTLPPRNQRWQCFLKFTDAKPMRLSKSTGNGKTAAYDVLRIRILTNSISTIWYQFILRY